MCSGYGAVYGAFSFRTAWGSRQLWQHERRGPFRETWRRTTSVAPDRGRSRVALDRVGAASALAPANRAAPFRGGVPPFWWTPERLVGIVRLGGKDAPPCQGDRTFISRTRRSSGVKLLSCSAGRVGR